MTTRNFAKNRARTIGLMLVALGLGGCNAGMDFGGYNLTSVDPTRQSAPRPQADARGVISYPNYQVVLARRGDTVADVANRIGLSPDALARHNGLATDDILRDQELLALPGRVKTGGGVDIASIATNAIDTADRNSGVAPSRDGPAGVEPVRHRVERGETAYSIARLYDVSVTALASWNGLGTDLAVREGQHLLIPIVDNPTPRVVDSSKPGRASATPTPPSARKPLPATVETAALPDKPGLDKFKSGGDDRKFLMPVQGKVIRPYSGKQGGNEGIDIAAAVGTAVKAAEDGEVALISKSVGANTIVLLRHADNIYTVYSNVNDVNLSKGQKVKRGQRIGGVASGSPSFLHFEVRKGTQSVDPAPYL